MKIYIGEFEGNHWAVESEREKPPSWLSKETYNWTIWEEHLSSLPRILCSDSLVRGLKVGDVVEGREQKQMTTWKKEVWYDCEDAAYENTTDDCRRIILVPVKEEQLMYEQDLPENMSQEDYDKWYAQSKLVDSVRMGPVYKPQEQGEDELWNRVVATIAAADICSIKPGDVAGTIDWKKKVIERLKNEGFKITKSL